LRKILIIRNYSHTIFW